jgi:hypothetical protein
MIAGFVEFEFDLPDALLARLIQIFSGMASAPLLPSNIVQVPEEQGVYQLLLHEEIVYIGKTDSKSGLRNRLQRHARKVQHRTGLAPEDVSFKAVRIYVFTAMDLEAELLRHYRALGSVAWDRSGFGSNDPGKYREATTLQPDGYDAQFPIDVDREITLSLPVKSTAAQVLQELRNILPYPFRIETVSSRSRSFHPELGAVQIDLPSPPLTTRKVIQTVLAALPPGWQATALAGRLIMYREHRDYIHGQLVGRS